MREITTQKFYMGFPVFILTLFDESEDILSTTLSSAYSLGDQLVIGMSRAGHTAQKIKVGTRLAANFLSDEDQLLSDIAGFIPARRRSSLLAETGVKFEVFDSVPYLPNSLITVIAEVTQIVTDERYQHLFLTIESRLLANEQTDFQTFNPLLYVGDDKIRYYKKTTQDLAKSGSTLRKTRK
ncbi:MAG: flavin reductase [Streptococcaceae bacterium]|jgi:flavin reductase (DIM6/NTAB) family NADH-FMN oxidoreductase RutF|nr:flavin reductase [Streptococcaceae bacterium]